LHYIRLYLFLFYCWRGFHTWFSISKVLKLSLLFENDLELFFDLLFISYQKLLWLLSGITHNQWWIRRPWWPDLLSRHNLLILQSKNLLAYTLQMSFCWKLLKRALMWQLRSQFWNRWNFALKVSGPLWSSSHLCSLIPQNLSIINISLILVAFFCLYSKSSRNSIDTSTIGLWIQLAKEIRGKVN